VDRLVAFCSLVAFAKVQQSNRGMQKRLETTNKKLENPEKSHKLKLNPFRHMGRPAMLRKEFTKPNNPFRNLR
jgi:hypothetical protein